MKITRRRKAERKRVSRSSQVAPVSKSISSSPNKTRTKDRRKTEQATKILPKTNRKWELKPHYLTALDAAAKSQGPVYYAYGCDYCEDRLRTMKATKFKIWKKEAVLNGFDLIAEHDQLVESVRTEIEKSTLEERTAEPEQQVCMDDIVRMREEPGYVVRYRLNKKKRTGNGKEQMAVEKSLVPAGSLLLSGDESNKNDMVSEDDWEDLEWDTSDGSGSMGIEFSDDGKVQ